MSNETDKRIRKIKEEYEVISPYGPTKIDIPIPFYKSLSPGAFAAPAEIPINPTWLQETCGFKIITGGVMGAVMGVGLGLFMGAVNGDIGSAIAVSQGKEVPPPPAREQLRSAWKATLKKSAGWARNFGILTALFGGIDCLIEKGRAKRDVWNPMISGCTVGATLSAKGGPAAACIGCAGFAGFSLVVDKIMGH